jgi:hypothetical protein
MPRPENPKTHGSRPPEPLTGRRLSSAACLTAVKDAYDPENVFHLNLNIAPSGR